MPLAVDARLAGRVRDGAIRERVTQLARLALAALGDLSHLDDSLHEHFMSGGGAFRDGRAPRDVLHEVRQRTFRGLTALLDLCTRLGPAEAAQTTLPDDVDFGDMEAAPEPQPSGFDLGAGDIGALLGNIDEQKVASEAERFKALLGQVSSFEYGLRAQLDDLDRRLEVALGAEQYGQALEVLDDTQTSTSEGVYALLTDLTAAFLPDADPATIAPGYLSALGRALLVRRGLATLSRTVLPTNDNVLQKPEADEAQKAWALHTVHAAVAYFMGTDVFRAMRPADRWQIAQFEKRLREEPPGQARMTSEGLARYLESLHSINRREVLVNHDERVLAELRDDIESARQLLDLNLAVAAQMAVKGWVAARELYGRTPGADDRILGLGYAPPPLPTREAVAALTEALAATLTALSG